jgi:hypothetical protein
MCQVNRHRSNLSLTDIREHGFSCQKVFQNTARRSPKLWRSCVPLQFRDASGSLRVDASGKALHATGIFHFKPKSAQRRRCRFGKLQAEPLHSCSASSVQPAIADRTPQAGSSSHPTVPLRGSVEMMPRANCRGNLGIMMSWVGTSELNDASDSARALTQ